jgi:RND family efflux transporter MFP subunit
MPLPLTSAFTLAYAVAVLALAACRGDDPPPAAAASGAAAGAAASAASTAAPVTVTTMPAQRRDLPVLLSATGSVAPLSSVEVRAQVTSVVTRVHIKEGQFVRAGEPLFTLDSRTDEANVAKARAQLARDEVALADAQRQLARSRELLAQNFVSQGAVDSAQALVDSQAALASADRAAVEAARVGLSFARITAPSAGRAGAINVFPGSSVQANQTILVTITQLDPITVAFSLPQRHLGDALAALQGGGATVSATLPENGGSLSGRLQFVDNAIDASSGTVKAKAVFDNRERKLWPGAFLDVAMTVRTLKDAVVVPQAAIIQSARGTIVYVVEDGKAVLRPVQIVQTQGDEAAVTGVHPGDRVVLDGRQNLRAGTPVVERAREAAGRPVGAASGTGRARADAPSGAGSGGAPRDRSAQP